MNRKIVATGVLLIGLLVAMPVLAQNQRMPVRPPGRACSRRGQVGLLALFCASFTLATDILWRNSGARSSAPQEVSDAEVLDFFTVRAADARPLDWRSRRAPRIYQLR